MMSNGGSDYVGQEIGARGPGAGQLALLRRDLGADRVDGGLDRWARMDGGTDGGVCVLRLGHGWNSPARGAGLLFSTFPRGGL